MISYELWMNDLMFDIELTKELPRVGEVIHTKKGVCKVKRVHYVLNQPPKVFVEKLEENRNE